MAQAEVMAQQSLETKWLWVGICLLWPKNNTAYPNNAFVLSAGDGAIIHACTLQDNCVVESGAIVFDGAVVESNAVVGAGAVITKGKKVGAGQVTTTHWSVKLEPSDESAE